MVSKLLNFVWKPATLIRRLLRWGYLHTVLRFTGSPRFERHQFWTSLRKLGLLAKRNRFRSGILTEEGEYFLLMPEGLRIYYNVADPEKTLGDGQALDMLTNLEEDQVWDCIQALLADRDVYIDVGANNGYFYTLRVAKSFPNAKVLAFEPDPKIGFHLQRNIKANALKNVIIEKKALGDKSGTSYISPIGGAKAFTSRTREALDWVQIPMLTLDNYLASSKIERPRVVKVDIEGGEFAFLQGASEVLANQQTYFILEEKEKWLVRAGASSKEMRALLRKQNYAVRKFRGQEDILAYPISKKNLVGGLEPDWFEED